MDKFLKVLAFIAFLVVVGVVTFFIADKYIDGGATNTTQNVSGMAEQEALNIGESLYQKAVDCYLTNIKTENIKAGASQYVKITNQDALEDIQLVLINNAFQKYMDYSSIEERDGIFYKLDTGRGSNPAYIGNDRLTINKIEDEKITYMVTVDYTKYDDRGFETDEIETEDYDFIVVKDNGDWKVTEFTLPY